MAKIDDVLPKESDLDLTGCSNKFQDSKFYQDEIERQEKELERLETTLKRIELEKEKEKKNDRLIMVLTLMAGVILGVALTKLFDLFFG